MTLGAKVLLIVFSISIFILFVFIFILVKRIQKEQKQRLELKRNEEFLFRQGNVNQLNPDYTADEQAELLPYDPIWEIEKENIKLG